MVAVAGTADAERVAAVLTRAGERVVMLGEVIAAPEGAARVAFRGRLDLAG